MPKIVVIGSGIAGLFAALRLSEAGNQVTIITKERSVDSSTNWAQGGIAGILDKTDGAIIFSVSKSKHQIPLIPILGCP